MAERKTTKRTTTRKAAPKSATRKTTAKRSTRQKKKPKFGDSLADEMILLVILLVCVLLLVSLFTDKLGIVGEFLSTLSKGLFGFSSVLLPILTGAFCIWMLGSEEKEHAGMRLGGGILLLLSISAAAQIFNPVTLGVAGNTFFGNAAAYYQAGNMTNGGLLGGLLGSAFYSLFNWGSAAVLLVFILIAFMMITGKSIFAMIMDIAEERKERQRERNERIKAKAEEIRRLEALEEEREAKREAQRGRKRKTKEDYNIQIEKEHTPAPVVEETVFRKRGAAEMSVKKREPIYDYIKEMQEKPILDEPQKESPTAAQAAAAAGFTVIPGGEDAAPVPDLKEEEPAAEEISFAGFTEDAHSVSEEIPVAEDVLEPAVPEDTAMVQADTEEPLEEVAEESISTQKEEPLPAKKEETPPQPPVEEGEPELPYIFPPFSLLGKDPGKKSGSSKLEALENAKKLENTLRSFGVEAKVIQVNQGPTVTRYELTPSVGVKVSKIVSLSDDIALNLAASGIRIEAPIPGKAAVGIEVPNKETQSVYLRTVLESDAYKKFPSKLAFALGEDIAGNPVVTDIAKMPHLLIAGATGSGKSVCINTLICSILYKAEPKEVKLLLVDPKVVELSVYNGIPHLLIPVVTDPKKAASALNWAVKEMLQRYNDFAAAGVRDIKGYNAWKEEEGKENEKMPQIVIIIDELADLMMAAPGEVEDSICRLAQMARAAGMHLIIATQRPSVDVITGVIKANIPSRLAFAVSSGIDSRTILDMVGAEKLVGKGDMLFYPVGQNKPTRLQGAFVTDKEVEKIVEFLRETSKPSYTQEMIDNITSAAGSGSTSRGTVDELFDQAVELVIEKEKGSASMLQRYFRVGYNRAANMIEEMERQGIVGPDEGSKPRKVLISQSQWEDMRDGVTHDDTKES